MTLSIVICRYWKLICKVIMVLITCFLLSALTKDSLGIAEVLLWRKDLVDGVGRFININMLRYQLAQ